MTEVQETYEAVRSRVKVGLMAPTAAIKEVAKVYDLPVSTVNWRYYDRLSKKRAQAAAARRAKESKADQETHKTAHEMFTSTPLYKEAVASTTLDGETQSFEHQSEYDKYIAHRNAEASSTHTLSSYTHGASGTEEIVLKPIHNVFSEDATLKDKLREKIAEAEEKVRYYEELLSVVMSAEEAVR